MFFKNLTLLIESTYTKNGNTPVVLIAHSMGGPLSLILLNNKPQSWKDKYIRALLTLSGAYGGSVKALKVFATGKVIIFFCSLLFNYLLVTTRIDSQYFFWWPHSHY